MKRIIIYSLVLMTQAFSSCKVDNYDAPNASLTGTIIDSVTNKPIQQDLLLGSVIDYIEQGYANPQTQSLRFHVDGTYANLTMFSGNYTVQAVRGNFQKTGKEDITISGKTLHNFLTLPYLRIIEPVIQKSADGTKIVATFKIDNVVDANIKSIGLFADFTSSVGSTLTNNGKTILPVGNKGNASTVYTIELKIADMPKVVKWVGNDYYFRVGALADVAEAKYNYETAVKIGI